MPRFRQQLIACLTMTLIAAGTFLGAIFAGVYNERAAWDTRDYHLPVIRQFARQWPRPDLSDYSSATGPGYHLALAAVHRFVSSEERVLRTAGAVFAIALIAVLGWAAGKHVSWRMAIAVCLPVVTSLYVFVSGVWLLPDDCSWLTVLIAIVLAYRRDRRGTGAFIAAAVVLALAVFVRQTNLWLAGPLVVGAALANDDDRPTLDWRRAAVMGLTALPAVLVLAWFYSMWHGLTPPQFQSTSGPLPPGHSGWQHEGPNLAVPAMTLAVFGASGVFFAGFLWMPLRKALSHRRAWGLLLSGLIVGFASAVLVPTELSHASGRYSGLWNVSARLPVIGHRSTLIAALAAVGGMLLMAWFVALDRRDRWVWLSAWACFIAAQTANAMAWQKYYEPFCLIMLALAAARVASRERPVKWAPAGTIALAALLACVIWWTFS